LSICIIPFSLASSEKRVYANFGKRGELYSHPVSCESLMRSLAFSTPLSGNVSSFPTSVSDKSDSSSPKIYGDEGFPRLVCGADGGAWSLPPDLLIFFPTVCYNSCTFLQLIRPPTPAYKLCQTYRELQCSVCHRSAGQKLGQVLNF
jgi:hypothetical protein